MVNRATLHDVEIAFVQAQRIAHLATSDEAGHPHVVPVCYAFDGSRFYTPIEEKPQRVGEQQLRRVRNIEARHEAMLLIDQYDDDWSHLGYVQVYGQAVLLKPGEAGHAEAVRLLRERYPQYRSMALETHLIIVITPQRVISWGPALSP